MSLSPPRPVTARVRAPELVGRGGWIGTGGRTLTLADLRGRFVLLDFWTFCCINCLHVLDELRELEHDYADVLVTVGVHSPKFAHEGEHAAVQAAVERYDVQHPVLDDPELRTWSAYGVRAWPTLTLIDPAGYIVAQMSGEGHAHALRRLLDRLVPEYEASGALVRGQGPYVPPEPSRETLRFPAKVLQLPGGTLLVADTGNHRLVEFATDGETMLRAIGTGERGSRDGSAIEAQFSEPQGMCLLPPDVAAQTGYDLVVADTVNHRLRGIALPTGDVTSIWGSGRQWMGSSCPAEDLSSPWDVAWNPAVEGVVVAMAGVHQLWRFDPLTGTGTPLAGTRNEGLLDGPAAEAWLAQPSGLAVQGDTLWFADAETSSLRRLRDGQVDTAIGRGLFDFGHRDGPADSALLQHPLGVTVLPDGSIAVCDTYNGAVRRYERATGKVTTLATGLAEPSDAVAIGDRLLVVESAAHRLTWLPLHARPVEVDGPASRTERPVTEVCPGPVTLRVEFEPPPGQKLDDRYGPATRLLVSATPPQLIREGAGTGAELVRRLVLDAAAGDGVLHIAARAASCDHPADGAPGSADDSGPACHMHQQDWGVPVVLREGAPAELTLMLGARVG